MRWILASLLTLASVAGMAAVLTRGQDAKVSDARQVADRLLEQGKPAETLALLRETSAEVIDPAKRLELEVAARGELKDVFHLASIYDREPEAVLADESAARLVARAAAQTGDSEAARKAEDAWPAGGESPHAWLCVKADRMLREGDTEAARELLESQTFAGDDDAGRLCRLATLAASEDLGESLRLLNLAVSKAPRSGDARSFRAQVLESMNRLPEARVEYVAAATAVPENPFYRLQLASFYARRGNLTLALDAWTAAAALPGGETAILSQQFWGRVARVAEVSDVDRDQLPKSLRTIADFLDTVTPERFWDEDAFQNLIDAPRLANVRQEVFWLRTLEALRVGDDEAAIQLLTSSRFRSTSWNAILEDALVSLLSYRLDGVFRPSKVINEGGEVHALVRLLLRDSDEPLSEATAAFLKTPEAVPAVLLACGWMEAAVRMPQDRVLPNDAPHYLAYAMCQAYRTVRPDEAIAFASRQAETPSIDVLLGELQYTAGLKDEAVATWRLAASDPGAAGYRASWMLSVELISRGRLVEAETTIENHADFAEAVAGREMLARVRLLQGDVAAAERLYAAIEDESLPARVFAIRRRLTAGDVEDARTMAASLLASHPDAPAVRKLVVDLNSLALPTQNTRASL